MANQIAGTFTGLQTSPKIEGRRFLAAVGEYGAATWAGTINVMWVDVNGVIRRGTDASGNVVTLTSNEQQVMLDFACPVTAWLQCTAFTSGNIKWFLGAETRLTGF
jgi:hypothetical protein